MPRTEPDFTAKICKILEGPRRPRPRRPRLIYCDGKIVGNAHVTVGPSDPNWYNDRIGTGFNGSIQVGPRTVGWLEDGCEWKYKMVD
jgi:hypothetical protein